MSTTFPYTSIHQYLDIVLQNHPNASSIEVEMAKKTYWKLYYTYYRKQKRKKRKEFTLGFYPDQLKEIQTKKGNKSISKFLYECVEIALQENAIPPYDKEVIAEIHLQLMQLITLVEELIETSETNNFNNLLERLEQLETAFSIILNPEENDYKV